MRLDKYINEGILTEGINDKGLFKACFMAGGSGAGKSTIMRKIKSGSIEPRVINVDTWIEWYKAEYETSQHQQAKINTISEVFQYVNSMLPLFIDSTSTDPGAAKKRKKLLENIGYETSMVYINIDLETTLKRVDFRNKEGSMVRTKEGFNKKTPQGKEYFNRIVPLKHAEEAWKKGQEVKDYFKTLFPLFMVINNNDGELTDEVVLKAYKKMDFFFTGPLKNELGQKILSEMRENGFKYLTPDVFSSAELKSIISEWYRL